MSSIAPNAVAILNTVEPISIFYRDANQDPTAVSNIKLVVYDVGNNAFIDDVATAARIANPALGQYTFDLGGISTETASSQKLLFLWTADNQPATVQTIAVVSVLTMMSIGQLQNQIDKSRKEVDDDPDEPLFLGYSTFQLLSYLEGGLSLINSFQPTIGWNTVDSFPQAVHGQTLIDAAMLVGIHSQELFAIDTDIPNFSNQGNVFVIEHFPKLESFANSLWQQLMFIVPRMKMQFVNIGSIHVEAGPNYRLMQLLTAASAGSLFRNGFVA